MHNIEMWHISSHLLGGSFWMWSFCCDAKFGFPAIVCGGCRARRGSRSRTLLTIVGFTGAILVRTFDGGIWIGINAACVTIFTGFGITGIVACIGSRFAFNILPGSTMAGTGSDGPTVGPTLGGVNPNCFCVAANSSSNFRFFSSNNSRCLIWSSVCKSFSV